jgi:hypothetical protein
MGTYQAESCAGVSSSASHAFRHGVVLRSGHVPRGAIGFAHAPCTQGREYFIRPESVARTQAYFFSSAGQFVSSVIDEDFVRSAVSTANRCPSGLTSYSG